jgi:hypothetical protein
MLEHIRFVQCKLRQASHNPFIVMLERSEASQGGEVEPFSNQSLLKSINLGFYPALISFGVRGGIKRTGRLQDDTFF